MTTAIDHFQSQANFITVVSANRLHLTVCGLFPTSCQVIRDHVITTQIPYCEQEMSSYKDDQENRLAIPFYHVYVNNLSATLQSIYSFLTFQFHTMLCCA